MSGKLKHLLILFLLFVATLNLQVYHVKAVDPPHELLVTTDEDYYYVKGDVMQIKAYSNVSVDATLNVYWNWKNFDDNELIYSNTKTCNATWNLPTQNQKVGFYKITVNTSTQEVTLWRTLIHYSNYSPESLPFGYEWKTINYTLQGRSLRATNGVDWFNITYPKIPFEHSTSFYRNNMTFLVRLQGSTWDVDLLYFTIHSGLKWSINGTLDNPQTFEFKLGNAEKWRKYLNRIRSNNNLVFDWGDLAKAKKVFSWNSTSKTLSVNIPSNFDIDPTIFEDGFESGFTPWDGTTSQGSGVSVVINTTLAHHGTNSCETIYGGSGRAWAYKSFSPTQSLVHCRFYFRTEAYPTGNDPILVYLNGSNWRTQLQFQSDGTFLIGESGISAKDGLTAIGNNTWNSIEMARFFDGSSGYVRLWINGTIDINATETGNPTLTADQIYIGKMGWGDIGTFSTFHDCVVVDDEYIGPEVEAPTYDFSGVISQTFSILSERIWSFAVGGLISSIWTINSQFYSLITKYFSGLINQIWTVNGLYGSEILRNFGGSISQLFTILSEREYAKLVGSVIGHVWTITSTREFISAALLNLSGDISQVWSVASGLGWSFSLGSLINQIWTIESTTTAVSAVIQNLSGAISQVWTIVSERVWNFNLYSAINQVWTIDGVADIFLPGLLSFSGSIGVVFEILRNLPVVRVPLGDYAIIMVAFSLVLPWLVLLLLRTRHYEETMVEESYPYEETDESV